MIEETYPMIKETIIIDGGSKAPYLKSAGADLFVDDNPDHIKTAMNEGIKSVLISNKNTPYNHNFNIPNLIKVNSISGIKITNGIINVI
jgi:hypothetical protein